MGSRRTGLMLAFAAYFAWGLLAPVGKILLEDLGPLSLNALRMVIAVVILMPLVPPSLWAEGIAYLRRPPVVILALLGGGLGFTFYIQSLVYVDATFAVLGFYTAPLWTAALAGPWLGEKLGKAFLPAVLVLLAGSWFALVGSAGLPGGASATAGFHLGGMALAVASGAVWGVYTVGLRQYAPGLRLRPLMVATFLASAAYFIVIAWLIEGPPPVTELAAPTWGWLILHAAVPTTLALWLFNASLQRAPAASVNILIGVELAATVLFSWWLLGDRFDGVQLTGLAVALAAVSGYLWIKARGEAPQSASD